MPICNIVDHRSNKFQTEVMAIYEDSWHDNSIDGATKFKPTDDNVMYLGIEKTTVEYAIQYVNQEISTAVPIRCWYE